MANRKEQTVNQDEDESFTKLSRLPVSAASGQKAVHSWRHAHAQGRRKRLAHRPLMRVHGDVLDAGSLMRSFAGSCATPVSHSLC